MHRSRLVLSCAAALALAACSSDRPEVVAPASLARAASGIGESSNGKYMLLAGNAGFSGDLAASVAALGGTVDAVHVGSGIAVVSGLTSDAAAQLAGVNGVNEVQPDVEISLSQPAAAIEADVEAIDPSVSSVANPATAVRYSWQWNMRDIHADAAWAAGKLGDAGVTVAILDTGIDYNNPDLNGLVDLSRSASFIPSDNAITATYFPTRNVITDYHGHGTNVAAQVSSKAAVHAGVTSKTTLIGVKVLAASGSGPLSAILNGVLWAADHGADVANMSLGGGFSKAGNGRYVSLINRTFNYANQKGMLVVVAAGNETEDLDHNGNELKTYCSLPHVVCVSAVGPKTATGNVDTPAFYTNFGRSSISVAGPGGNADDPAYTVSTWIWGNDIASWVWSYCSKTRLAGFTTAGVPILTACAAGNRVTGYIGTSQATPHVAGLAALLIAEKGKGQPQTIKQIIEKSADDLGQPGTDPYYGRGRINVAKALGL
jgi:subtilisin family serine protease